MKAIFLYGIVKLDQGAAKLFVHHKSMVPRVFFSNASLVNHGLFIMTRIFPIER